MTSRLSPRGKITRCSTRECCSGVLTAMGTVAFSVIVGTRLGEGASLGEVRAQPVVEHGQRGGDGHVHVEVLVTAEAAAEQHVRLLRGQLAVGEQAAAVL